MSAEGFVESKIQHMIGCLEDYADEIVAGDYEAAFEAADAIGTEDGSGCPICERLSSSLAGGVAYVMWFPDQDAQRKMGEELASHARSFAGDLRDEVNTS